MKKHSVHQIIVIEILTNIFYEENGNNSNVDEIREEDLFRIQNEKIIVEILLQIIKTLSDGNKLPANDVLLIKMSAMMKYIT